MPRFSPFAVLFGLCDSFVVALFVALIGTSLLQIETAGELRPFSGASAALLADARFLGVALAATFVGAFAGGYTAGVIAPGDELPNGLALGALLLPMGFTGNRELDTELLPLWYTLPTLLLTIPACVLGALLCRGRSPR
jgi:hypothetical protein